MEIERNYSELDQLMLEKLAGIQLALFELIWPSFPWIETICVAAKADQCSIKVQADEVQSDSEWGDCVRLLRQIFDSAFNNPRVKFDISFSKKRPEGVTFKEVMAQEIFELIARDVAPWRLDVGR